MVSSWWYGRRSWKCEHGLWRMSATDGGEGDRMFVSLERYHHGVEVPCHAPDVGQPRCPEDDVDVVADVDEDVGASAQNRSR